MNENQNIEWKENWRDEYLKWICGFTNAIGGRLYIGMDDQGKIVGVTDAKKLLEDIPNKVRNILGIIVDVNLLEENGLEYIEIIVPPYPNPIEPEGMTATSSTTLSPSFMTLPLPKFFSILSRVS
jgi:ATP-dependent DNA helicase RecG